jgi:hypothetical protein
MELEPCQDTPGIVDLVVLLVEEQKHWQHWYHITSDCRGDSSLILLVRSWNLGVGLNVGFASEIEFKYTNAYTKICVPELHICIPTLFAHIPLI